MKRLAEEFPNIRGIKYSVESILDLMEFKRAREGSFDVLVAPVQMLLPAMAAGIRGTVSGNCNIIPEILEEMFVLYENGKTSGCAALQEKVALITKATASREAAKCKALLARKGIIATDRMRSPQRGLTDAEREEIFRFFDENYGYYSYRR